MKESKNSQHLVIPVDILNLVYSRLVSCMVFPTKIIENMRKCRNAVTVNQELNFFKKKQKNPGHKTHCITILVFTKKLFFFKDIGMNE